MVKKASASWICKRLGTHNPVRNARVYVLTLLALLMTGHEIPPFVEARSLTRFETGLRSWLDEDSSWFTPRRQPGIVFLRYESNKFFPAALDVLLRSLLYTSCCFLASLQRLPSSYRTPDFVWNSRPRAATSSRSCAACEPIPKHPIAYQ